MKKPALALLLALALFGCNAPAGTEIPDAKGTLVKAPAPDFDLEDIAGGKLSAANLKGKVAIVDFWATWCEPCWSEVPKYNKLLADYQGKDVEIVGITVESPRKDIEPKAKELDIKYKVLVGNDKVQDDFGGMIGYPTTFVITKDWQIYKKYMGALPNKDAKLRMDIEKLLGEPSESAENVQ